MSYDKLPAMILFDVGGTLFRDSVCSPQDGFAALRKVSQNPDVTDDAALAAMWERFLLAVSPARSYAGERLETPLSAVLLYAEMQTGLRVGLPMAQQEELFDRCNSARAVIEGVPALLAYLADRGIRTAVVSNNMMSGESLALAVRHFLPASRMEFCLTSADLLLCKPCPDLFTAAARYAGVKPADCWYCGDGRVPDVDGALAAGMTPVLLDPLCGQAAEMRTDGGTYLAVRSWDALRARLEAMRDWTMDD